MKNIFLFMAFLLSGTLLAQWTPSTSSLTTFIHRDESVGIEGTGNGFLLTDNNSNNHSWGASWYGFARGNAATMDFKRVENSSSGHPLHLSGFYGLGFRTNEGRAALLENGIFVIGVGDYKIEDLRDNLNSSQDYLLYVDRGIRAESIKVDLQSTWADYVFEDGYALKQLSEVESFIKINKHLPGIPSSKELKESGIDLAKMDEGLLLKIEELTLYIIDLEKRIKTLESK